MAGRFPFDQSGGGNPVSVIMVSSGCNKYERQKWDIHIRRNHNEFPNHKLIY